MTPKQVFTVCVGCKAPLGGGQAARNPRKWCSEACRVRAFRAKNPQYVERQAELAAKRHRENHAPSRHALICVVCGEEFVGVHSTRKYCSQRCRNRVFNARRRADGRAAEMSANRRALEAGAKVSRGRRLAVLEADSWVCHLCGELTDRDSEYPDPNYPVVDHVVPLSKGGAHDPSNWRCAHNLCNSRRGNMSVARFRKLFVDVR